MNRQRKLRVDAAAVWGLLGLLPRVMDAPVEEAVVALVSDRRIAELNRRHLRRPSSTDILAYRLSRLRAELVISAETAARNARAYGHSLAEEVAVLAAHGILHLQGHDDACASGLRAMDRRQKAVLSEVRRIAGGRP